MKTRIAIEGGGRMKCIGAICQHYRFQKDTCGEWFAFCECSDELIEDDYECPKVKEETNE